MDDLDRKVKECVGSAETALRGIRTLLREKREAPGKERNDFILKHRHELARIAYRLKIQGVTAKTIGVGFGLDPVAATRLSNKGEILEHGGKSRDEQIDALHNGEALSRTGLFSQRVLRVLQRNGIHGLNDLCRRTPQELVSFLGLGMRSLREIDQVLEEIGRRLGDTDDDLCSEDERLGSEEQG